MAAGMKLPSGIILAGGQARRMGGGDKGLLAIGDRTMLDHVIERLAPQVAELALNANGDETRFAEFGLPVLADPVAGNAGPLAGVLAGLDWAAGREVANIVTAAADTPFLPADLVTRLLDAAVDQGRQIALASTATGLHPTFGLWPVALRDDLRSALSEGVRKVVDWTERHGAARAEFPVREFDPFFNVNTPEDLDRAQDFLESA